MRDPFPRVRVPAPRAQRAVAGARQRGGARMRRLLVGASPGFPGAAEGGAGGSVATKWGLSVLGISSAQEASRQRPSRCKSYHVVIVPGARPLRSSPCANSDGGCVIAVRGQLILEMINGVYVLSPTSGLFMRSH